MSHLLVIREEVQVDTNLRVVQKWIRGEPGRSLSLATDGRTLFSYMTAIAWKRDLQVEYNPRWYSPTTTGHKNLALLHARYAGFKVKPAETVQETVVERPQWAQAQGA